MLRFDRAHAQRTFGALTVPPQTTDFPGAMPFAIAQGIVAPGTTTQAHRHPEDELFIVLSGHGWFVTEEGRCEVRTGHVVHAKALALHHFENADLVEELKFLKLWWEDPMQLAEGTDQALSRLAECAPNVLVTATPPTPNGDLHVGHLSGPYLRADAYTRFLRLTGRTAYYLTGIDDHQSYVALKGERISKTPQATAAEYGAQITATLKRAQIQTDWIGQPRASGTHIALVKRMLQEMYTRGELVAKNAPAPFCERCDEFIFEAYISGNCPHCNAPSGGNACEVCGRPNDCADLQNSRCSRCGTKPVLRKYERLYFPLARHAAKLADYWSSVHMGAHLRSLCARMLAAGLPDIAVTHRAPWGIPVPLEEFETQTIYVWFEMAAGYLAATQDLCSGLGSAPDWHALWHENDWDVVQFFGYDNGYFHAVLFPALLKCFDDEIRLPVAFVTNEFYRLDGSKFSTSRSHAVWGHEFFAQVPVDVARLYLAFSGPETEQTNFTYSELATFSARELSGHWNGWLRKLTATVHEACAGRAPAAGLWMDEHVAFYGRVRDLVARAARAYCARMFSLQEAARILCELVRIASDFAQAQTHWLDVPAEERVRRSAVALQLSAARTLAILSAPLMPSFARSLWVELGHEPQSLIGSWNTAGEMIKPGLSIGRLEFAEFERLLPTA